MMMKNENSQNQSDDKKQWLSYCDFAEIAATQTIRRLEDEIFGWPLQRLIVGQETDNSGDMSSEREDAEVEESALSMRGWPLLRIAASSAGTMSPRDFKAPELSVVEWLMDLPNRSLSVKPRPLSKDYDSTNELDFLYENNSPGRRMFSYAELSSATSHFSTENLIGEGGCSSVYRGCLGGGESVAVKTLKSYQEAWDDFFLEAKFVSSIQHKHITSLVGLCVEDSNLILVYDLFPRGSLEANLHGCSDGSVLPWEKRFKVAVAVAEALTYLHNDCPRPIIHRDVKSSNILLSDELQPQLSDFGLAMWGPTDSSYVISSDVVGTFGYIAPEYFMNGRVSDKIDVYAFGVVLLELLTGRKPVDTRAPKGQESLAKWARHMLETGDLKALLDPKFSGDYNVDQMRRMVMAAGLCTNQSARLRPKANQVLKLLTGETDAYECVNTHVIDSRKSQDDDDLSPEEDFKSHSVSAMSDTNDGSISSSSTDTACSAEKPGRRYKLKDYLATPDHYSLSEIFLLSSN